MSEDESTPVHHRSTHPEPVTHKLDMQRFRNSFLLPDEPHQTPPNPQKILSGPQKGRDRGDKNSGRDRRFDGPRHYPKETKNVNESTQSPNGQPVQTAPHSLSMNKNSTGEAVISVMAVGATLGVIVVASYAACLGVRKLIVG